MSSIENVVANGMCVGCGGCGTATSGRIPIRLTTRGAYEADLAGVSSADKEIGSRVCPFADESKNEDEIADEAFAELQSDPRTGRYLGMYAGRITDDKAITKSSSGGLTNWTLTQLILRGEVDGVIHVGSTESPMFGYVVSHSVDELMGRRKSQYYPASFADTLRGVRGNGKRYAFVGVPCAIRSIRLVVKEDEVLAEQIAYFVGIVCGHMKSMSYAESFAWQLGIPPEEVENVDFRIKDPELTSRQYKFGAQDRRTDEWSEKQTLSLVGGSWGHAVFQLEACNYCDDIFAETADVVFGDAWLSKYEIDWRGTNVVITRNVVIDEIVREGLERGEIDVDILDIDTVAKTQGGNFRHRREGLAVRLADDEKAGRWTPRKRVAPGYGHVDAERVALIRRRREISAKSHDMFLAAKEQNDLGVYINAIKPLIDSYQQSTKMTFTTRVRNKAQREFWKVVRRVRRSN
ncbi:Coenzyme F420 hydrogenase/dehydrogenase, beta subunit C-terminal domain [Compostimonas suwonensis]|uniref:Coenzyme F420-reducing hydrogenase beta subunit n=1 Tax=Compostimonas suwonensis TaxID=1048394 RepID=A0A2M9BC87_9MICO|nr:Coenzyme F420 hydrogenase/dehydrogenase, beta subunit C-terminal domain [Compostimonas suwonensis]PJJ55559.1 coenzyme F420-reducing hydrogenase beta subunit [Compostimonas suwonensis]